MSLNQCILGLGLYLPFSYYEEKLCGLPVCLVTNDMVYPIPIAGSCMNCTGAVVNQLDIGDYTIGNQTLCVRTMNKTEPIDIPSREDTDLKKLERLLNEFKNQGIGSIPGTNVKWPIGIPKTGEWAPQVRNPSAPVVEQGNDIANSRMPDEVIESVNSSQDEIGNTVGPVAGNPVEGVNSGQENASRGNILPTEEQQNVLSPTNPVANTPNGPTVPRTRNQSPDGTTGNSNPSNSAPIGVPFDSNTNPGSPSQPSTSGNDPLEPNGNTPSERPAPSQTPNPNNAIPLPSLWYSIFLIL